MQNKYYGQTCSFNRGIAWETSIPAALLFDELSFWSSKGSRKDGYVYKTYADLVDRLPLSKYQLRMAYRQLVSAGYIEYTVKKANGAPTVHYRMLRNLTLESKETALSKESKETALSITAANQQLTTSIVTESGKAAQTPARSSGLEFARRKAMLIRSKALAR